MTCGALIAGFGAFRRGNKALGNNMLKLRVIAQGATVVAMIIGATYFGKDKEATKKAAAQKELARKMAARERWLQELDQIDREEKRMRELAIRRDRKF